MENQWPPPYLNQMLYDENLEFDQPDEEYERWLDETEQAGEAELDREHCEYSYKQTAMMLAGGLF